MKGKDDRVDPEVLLRFGHLLRHRGTCRRFTFVDLGGQDFLIGCATPEERDLLARGSGLRVQWL